MEWAVGRHCVVLVGLSACAGLLTPAYDAERLAAADAPEAVLAALPPDEVLLQAAACASGGEPDTLAEAAAVHALCDLGELASEHDFSVATGDRMRAARAFLTLRDRDPTEAVRVGRLLLGPPAIPADADPPVVPGLPARELGAFTRIDTPLTGTGAWGRFPYWHLDELDPVDTVLIDKDLDVGTLRYVLASSGGDVRVVVRSDRITTVTVRAVSSEAAAAEALGADTEDAPSVAIVDPDDSDLIGEVLAGMHPSLVDGARVAVVIAHRPCGDPPAAGMRCVRGRGPVDTFWIDEVPTEDAAACTRRGACRSVPGTWRAARELCSYLGKRLPTSWEADRAGLGAVSPAMWTATWEGPGEPPRGRCDGSPYCPTATDKRLTDGTSRPWMLPLKSPVTCVTDRPWLTAWPPVGWDVLPPEPPLPGPDPERAALAADVTPDPLDAKGVCGEEVRAGWIEELRRGGRSTTECRDPQSYVTSNEPDRFLFGRLVRNLGGAYVGVGSDQSYDFIASARSEWAWVYDYDPNVIRLHRISQPLLRAAETRQDYVALWDDPDRALPLIEAAATDDDDARVLTGFYLGWRRRLHRHYRRQLDGHPELDGFGWLAADRNYTWIRTLAQQARIVPTPLDLLGSRAMRSVGAQARAMGVPVRVFYTSNAPTAWGGQATPDYRRNVTALPFDDRTRVLQTTNKGAFDQEGRWHYNVMDGLLFQQRMASGAYRWNHQPMWDRIPGDHGNLTVLGLRTAEVDR